MIINFYIPENDSKLIDLFKTISDQKQRSFSFIMREAMEYYLLNASNFKKDEIHLKKEGKSK